MNLSDLFQSGEHIMTVLAILCTMVQIAPIKINPWTVIARWIGKSVNGEAVDNVISEINRLNEDVKVMDKSMEELRSECDKREAMLCRVRFMRFGDEVLRKITHTKDYFDQILCDITIYEKYCEKNADFEENKIIAQTIIKRIKEEYARCIVENDFL